MADGQSSSVNSQADANADRPLRRQLAELKKVPLSQIGRIRVTNDGLPCIVNVAAIMMNTSLSNAARDVRRMLQRFPDLNQKLIQVHFGGRGGNRESQVPKDVPALIEFILLFPGQAAAQIRRQAAEIFVLHYGVDLAIIGQVEQIPRVQEALASETSTQIACAPSTATKVASSSTDALARPMTDFDSKGLVLVLRRRFLRPMVHNHALAVRRSHVKTKKELQTVSLALQTSFNDKYAALEARLTAMKTELLDDIERRNGQLAEQSSLRVIFMLQRALRPLSEFTQTLKALPFNLALRLRGCVKDVMDATVTNVDSVLVRTLRKATKGPARRRTINEANFPEEQRATTVQHNLEAMSLAVLAHELCPEMTYPAWLSIRSPYGKAAVHERIRCHAYPSTHPLYVEKPRLWTYSAGSGTEGGGARMLFLRKEKSMLTRLWFQASPNGSFHDRAIAKSAELPNTEAWPQHAAELEFHIVP